MPTESVNSTLVSVEGDAYNGTGFLMRKGTVHIRGDAGMNAGAHLDGGVVVVDGMACEFAGAYMKAGTLILNDAKGFGGGEPEGRFNLCKKENKSCFAC